CAGVFADPAPIRHQQFISVVVRGGQHRGSGPPRDRRAPPPLGIAFRVSLVAPPRSVRGPDGAEWVPSAGTSNGPLSAPRPRPTISAPARDGSGAVPSPSPRCSPLP